MSDVPSEFRPRKCHVVKWPEFTGYGFNLHAEKGKAGQYIGKVDPGSPAETAGLRDGDRIVEVNSVNIGNENHQQVVSRIKAGGEETTLLVVSTEADKWYKDEKRVIKGDLPEVHSQTASRNVVPEEEQAVEDLPEPSEPELPPPEPEVEAMVAAPVSAEVNGVNGDADHQPRLCHLKIWPHFQGYGFNLHAERDKPGQFIGLVDANSPASTAGLKVNDRIIEVNGENVEQFTHTDVISRIKAVQGETKLLVLDREDDTYYRERGVTVSSSMPQTHYQMSTDPSVNGVKSSEPEPPAPEPEYTVASSPQPKKSMGVTQPLRSQEPDALGGGMTVAEMKERLKAKKKPDPRLQKMSFEQKFKDFQKM